MFKLILGLIFSVGVIVLAILNRKKWGIYNTIMTSAIAGLSFIYILGQMIGD